MSPCRREGLDQPPERRLGDRRSRAITLGDIARLRADKGEVDQALQQQQERRQLGDLDGQAAGRSEIHVPASCDAIIEID
jgi:hypothetical protein